MRTSLRYLRPTAGQPLVAAFLAFSVFILSLSLYRAGPAAAQGAPPESPTTPRPPDGSTSQSILSTLRWEAIDFDDDMAGYDVYLGLDSNPPLVAANLTYKSYQPATLDPLSTYFWRVVARDAAGHETSSPTWSFSTGPENIPPDAPSEPAPSHASTGHSPEVNLAWSSSDLDGDAITYSLYLGTDASPPLVASGVSQTSYDPGPLAFATTYYWRIVALDARGAETSGPLWNFTTRTENQPPVVPFSPVPYSGAPGVSLTQVSLSWHASDPEGDTLVYDLYLGPEPSPPLMASNLDRGPYGDRTYYSLPGLTGLTTYYWKVVARDALGAETTSPVWVFTTKANSPPYTPHLPDPADGSTGVSVTANLHWFAGDPDAHPVTYDIYFGTENPPPLVTSTAPRQFSTQYWWKIVARDPFGLESAGPVWSFTTGGNRAPLVTWSSPTPPDNGQGYPVTTLRWWASDPDEQPTFDDVYFGTSEPLPLIVSDVSGVIKTYALPDTLDVGTKYYWRIVTSDGELESTGKTWSFTVVHPGSMGDVNNDGQEAMDDIDCAMEIFFDPFCVYDKDCCGGLDSPTRADVNCDQKVTPRDARCIHKHMLDGSCTYCEGTAAGPSTRTLTPIVSKEDAWIEYDTLFVRLAVSNVPALEAFGLYIETDPGMTLKRVVNLGAADGFYTRVFGPRVMGVGGYFLNAVDASSPVTLIEVVYFTKSMDYVRVRNFADDLAGSPDLTIYANEVPVLFSSFRAAAVSGGVRVSWELVSDEAMEKFTLYRRDDAASPARMIAEGPVQSTRGSYLDQSAQPGRTYSYELLIETAGGDVFRSPIATATTAALRLALYQNYPNPFNPRTVIRYDIPGHDGAVRVKLWILDIAGHIVRTLVDEDQGAGAREVIWKGTNDRGETVSSGVYFSVLDAGGERRTRKLVLLK